MEADNDNDEFSFVTLQAATRNVTRYLGLDEKNDEQATNDRSSSDEEEKRALERIELVNRRLRDLQRFENRARGRKQN